jgi:hypothetical protein
MIEHDEEYERKKRAIFDAMSPRGQKRIMRLGYDNWDPFQEPKDPRERIRNPAAKRAADLMQDFLKAYPQYTESYTFHRDLMDLCRGVLRNDLRTQMIFDFCHWYRKKEAQQG